MNAAMKINQIEVRPAQIRIGGGDPITFKNDTAGMREYLRLKAAGVQDVDLSLSCEIYPGEARKAPTKEELDAQWDGRFIRLGTHVRVIATGEVGTVVAARDPSGGTLYVLRDGRRFLPLELEVTEEVALAA
jgi:hypothetical protein